MQYKFVTFFGTWETFMLKTADWEEVTKLMREQGWNMEELAKKTGYSTRTLKGVKSGEVPFSGKLLGLINEAIDREDKFKKLALGQRGKLHPQAMQRIQEDAGEYLTPTNEVVSFFTRSLSAKQISELIGKVATDSDLSEGARMVFVEALSSQIKKRIQDK